MVLAYDNNGNGPIALDEYSYSWDGTDQITTETQTVNLSDGPTKIVQSRTNKLGLRSRLTYPDDRRVNFTYDILGRPTAITDNTAKGGLVRYGYAGLYLESKTYGNGANGAVQMVTSDLGYYDSFGRLTTCSYRKGTDASDLVLLKYKYDYASNITWRFDDKMQSDHGKNWSQIYAYDSLHRLAEAQQGEVLGEWPDVTFDDDLTWTWDDLQANGPELDKLGNWVNFNNAGTTDARTHNTANEVASRTLGGNSRVVSHDVAGNLCTLQDETGTTGWRYTYDYRNRLIEVESTDDITVDPELVDWDPVATYAYDALNRRVKKDLTSGNDIMYTYDGWRCIEESEYTGGQWVAMRQYVYGARYLDELVARNDLGASPETYFYLQDTNYNVVALYKLSTGSVAERYWYEPYGTVTITEEDGDSQASPINEVLLFQGQRRDPETELCYFKNRYYSPVLGRFLQRDPIGYRDGMTLYEFEGGGPCHTLDSTGRSRNDLIAKLMGLPVRKAVGLNASQLTQLKAFLGPGLAEGAGVSLVFFPDTCEVALFSLTAGMIDTVTGGPESALGEPYEGGQQVSATGGVELAWMTGPPGVQASAESFAGVFHTGSVSFKAEGVPMGASLYVGDEDKEGRRWYGGTLGVGPGKGAGIVNWDYHLSDKRWDLDDDYGAAGLCLCYYLISQMP